MKCLKYLCLFGLLLAPTASAAPMYHLTTLVSFNFTNGAFPDGDLVADANGNLYGTTRGGGASGRGTVFELSPVPEPSTLLLLCIGSLAVLWRRRGLFCAAILAAAVGATFADHAAADTFGSGANTFDIEFVNDRQSGQRGRHDGQSEPRRLGAL